MINIDNIGNLKKCRIWTVKPPLTKYQAVKVLNSIVEANDHISKKNQDIVVELFVAPRYYALLGIEYIFEETSNLKICVNITENTDSVLKDSLSLPSDNVHLGISNEYSQIILNTAVKVCKNLSTLPPGILTFNIGAYSDYGSNQVIFSKITSILIRLLVAKLESSNSEELKSIVRNELERSLTDI